MRRLFLLLLSLLLLAYPFAVYFGLQYGDPRWLGLLLLVAVSVRYLLAKKEMGQLATAQLLPLSVAGIGLAVLIILFNNESLVLINPVLINVVLFSVFAWSLYSPPPIIERIARLSEPDLPPEGVAYTRTVTKAWMLFFLVSGCHKIT